MTNRVAEPVMPTVLTGRSNIQQYNIHKQDNRSKIVSTQVNEVVEDLIKKVHKDNPLETLGGLFTQVLDTFCDKECKLQKDGSYKYKDKSLTMPEYYSIIMKFSEYREMYFQIMSK